MAVKANPWAIGTSSFVNLAILAIAIWLGINIIHPPTKQMNLTSVDVSDILKAPKLANPAGGGGGGGSHDIVDPMKGKLPPRMKDPITPPMVPILEKPKLAFTPAINVQKDITLPDNPAMVNFGVKNSANVTAGLEWLGRRRWHGQRLRRRYRFGKRQWIWSGQRRKYRRRRVSHRRRCFGSDTDLYT